jgi:serine/threonine protein kinase
LRFSFYPFTILIWVVNFYWSEILSVPGSLTGQEINEYIIGPRVGDGGMGSVFQAFPKSHGEVVAIKFLRGTHEEGDDLRQRFSREIRVMESLHHENLVPILGHGIHQDMLYFTMKLISGVSLAALLRKQPFTPLDAWGVLHPVSEALTYMHAQNVIHRDVKPENIFLERQGENWHVYLGDFGLSKNIEQDETLTIYGSKIGTAEYMSPEAAMGQDLDHRADVYCLAGVVYEMLVGALPKPRNDLGRTGITQILSSVILPTQFRTDFPSVLQEVLVRGLERHREIRYQTVYEFTSEFRYALMELSPEQRSTVYQIERNAA